MESLIDLKSFTNESGVDGLLDGLSTATLLDKVTITVVSPDTLSGLTDLSVEDGELVYGYTDFTTNTIYINNSLSIDAQRRAVSYELMAWCNGLYGLGLSRIHISVLGQFFYSLVCHE